MLVAVFLLVRMLFAGVGAGDPSDQARASGQATQKPGATKTHSTDASPTHTPIGTITPSPGTGGPPAAPGGGTGHTNVPAGDNGTAASGSDAPPACPDSALRLVVDTDQTEYQVGDHPVVRLALTNTSTTACARDVGAAEQEALVYTGPEPGQHHLWSSNDCDPGGDQDVRVLGVGQSLTFSVTWPAESSQPDCAGTPTPAAPGDYSVVVRIGTLHSDPARFTFG